MSMYRTVVAKIIGEDHASLAFQKVGVSADKFAGKATKAGGVFGRAMSGVITAAEAAGLPVEGLGRHAERMGRDFEHAGKKSGGAIASIGAASGVVALAIAAAAGAIAVSSIKIADAYEKPHASLEAAVKASHGSWKAMEDQLGPVEQKYASLGFTADQVESALAGSVISTQSSSDALKRLGLDADLARMKNIPLAEASSLVNRAMTGQLRPLKALGIDLPIAASSALKLKQAHDKLKGATDNLNMILLANHGRVDKNSKAFPAYVKAVNAVGTAHKNVTDLTGAHSEIEKELARRLNGQASGAANTYSGKMQALHAQMHNLQIVIGQKLIPVVQKIVGWLTKGIDYLSKHHGVLVALGIVIGTVLVGAFILWAASIWDSIGALTVLDVELGGIPILLGLLVLGAIYLATHWKQVWKDIKHWVKEALDWVTHHIAIVIAVGGPFGLLIVAIAEIGTHWKQLTRDIKHAWTWLDTNVWQPLSSFFSGLGDAIGGALSTVADTVKAPFIDAFNAILAAYNNTVGLIPGMHIDAGGGGGAAKPNFGAITIPSVGSGSGKSFSFKGLATGGPASANTPYIVGERGPELFVPRASGTIIPNGATMAHPMGAGQPHIDQSVHVDVQTNASEHAIAAAVSWAQISRRAA